MSLLVLGATGFVGTNVCDELQKNMLEYKGVSLHTGVDLRQPESITSLLEAEKPSFILNFAAHVGSLNYVTEKAADVIKDNGRMILSLYEAVTAFCPGAVIINPLASCSYPGHLVFFEEEKWQDGPVHPSVFAYGSVRRFTWAVSKCYKEQYNIKTISLITPNMYGPHDSTDPNIAHALNALVSKFVKAQMTGQDRIEVWGTGAAIREWLYAGDFARIIVQIIKNPDMQGITEPFNIGQNFGLSIKELVGFMQKHISYSGTVYYNTEKPDGAPKKVMDDRKFRRIFPDFRFTSLEDGIEEVVKYYQSVYPY